MRLLPAYLLVLTLSACAQGSSVIPFHRSSGEVYSESSYVPLDGLPVMQVMTAPSCLADPNNAEYKSILQSLPDISVRFAVARTSGESQLGFAPVAVTAKGARYRAILDYVNNDAIPITFALRKTVFNENGIPRVEPFAYTIKPTDRIVSYEASLVETVSTTAAVTKVTQSDQSELITPEQINSEYTEVTLPVYVGLGLRITADVVAIESDVTISGLGSFGGEKLNGGLTVQSIGINGALVSGAIPTPSRLDQTTIENAILAIGSGRTAIYAEKSDNSDISRTPRVVGLYSPIGTDPLLINAIYSELAKANIQWKRPCVEK